MGDCKIKKGGDPSPSLSVVQKKRGRMGGGLGKRAQKVTDKDYTDPFRHY